mmetsp:Transcript_12956/g.30909  ORF Transcript_12956/g.30909 Transcript_12956/m.30909 type:complete len:297 (-) Transcript_12956:2747-3637(-)
MRALDSERVELLLELDEPLGHQVDVLQHYPVALLVTQVQLGHCNHILTLPHGDVVEVDSRCDAVVLAAHRLHLLDGVGTRRQDEEDRRGIGRVLERAHQHVGKRRAGVAVHEVGAVGQDVADIVGHGDSHTVRPQAAQHKEFLEGLVVEFLPVEGQLDLLRGHLVEPLLESIRCILLHVDGEAVKAWQLYQLLHGVPRAIGQPVGQGVLHIGLHGATQQELELFGVIIVGQLAPLQQAEREEGVEDEFVPLEKAADDPCEDGHADGADKQLAAFVEVLCLFGLLDTLVHEGDEGVE